MRGGLAVQAMLQARTPPPASTRIKTAELGSVGKLSSSAAGVLLLYHALPLLCTL